MWPRRASASSRTARLSVAACDGSPPRASVEQTSQVVLSYEALCAQSWATLRRIGQFHRISEARWEALFDRDIRDIGDLDGLYRDIAQAAGVEALFLRWNQAVSYAPLWLARADHYWISVVRDPRDRACSAALAWKWGWERSLAASRCFCDRNAALADRAGFLTLYYEELVADPESAMRRGAIG